MQQGSYLFNYVYSYTDHLGNIRLSYAKDPKTNTLKILEQNHYYPFGLKHENYNSERKIFAKEEAQVLQQSEAEAQVAMVSISNTVKMKIIPGGGGTVVYGERNYRYNQKEWQDELGLNMYDYGARFYDPAAPRFWQVDPVAETSRRFSPYSYALDNPVYFIDRDGMYADTLDSQNSGECCPGFPFGGNAPKETSPLGGTMQNFTPSNKTMSLLNEGKELLSNVFGYEASASAGYSIGASGTVGPVKVEGEVSVVELSAKSSDKNLVEAKAEGAGFKLSGSVGDAKAEVKATTGSTKVEVDKKLNVKTSSEGAKATATATMGKENKLSLSNSGTLAASVKIPTPEATNVKIGVSVNLYNAAAGAAKMIQGGYNYLSDYVSNYFSGN